MKRISVLLMVVAVCLSLIGCSKKLGEITSSSIALNDLISSESGEQVTSSGIENISSQMPIQSEQVQSVQSQISSSHLHKFADATCTKPKTCEGCGVTSGSALGHNWQEATCTLAKKCKVCGVVQGKALGHNWQEATYTSPMRCSRCNKTSGSAKVESNSTHIHSYADATCTKPATCSCGRTKGKALGHNFVGAGCLAQWLCSRCDAVDSMEHHYWAEATCTEPRTCEVCGATSGSALGHNWQEATCTSAKKCKVCGIAQGKALGHNWQEATYTSPMRCSRCDKTSGSVLEKVYTGTSIHTLPARTTFNVGEEFDYSGLTLRENYSDGSYNIINSDFDVSGFSSAKEGVCKISVKYNKYEEPLTFNVNIVVEDVALRKLTAFTGYNTVKTDVYDSYGNYYDRCMALSGTDEYLLNGNYSRLTAKIAVEEGYSKDEYYTINIYADDKLVYTKDKISPYDEPFDINVDIKKCKMLKIKVTATEYNGWVDDDYLLLINAELKK